MEATHKRRGRSGFWAGAASFLVILGFLSLASTRVARSDTDTDKHEMHVPIMNMEVGSRLAAGTDAWIRAERDLIREQKVVTYIDGACAGPCSVLFMGGVQRFRAPEAKLGFHQGSFPGTTDEEPAQTKTAKDAEIEGRVRGMLEEALALNRIVRIRNCEDGGHSCGGRFGADRASALSIQWFTSEELREAGVITGVASRNDLDVWRTDEILQRRQVFIDLIPSDLPDAEKGHMRQAINRSLDALQAKDLSGAAGAVQEIVAILERYPDSGRGDPALGHNLWAPYWLSCVNGCGGFQLGGSVAGAGVYAACYWSGLLAYSERRFHRIHTDQAAQEAAAALITAVHRITQPSDIVDRAIVNTFDNYYAFYGEYPSFQFWQNWIPKQPWSEQVKAEQLQIIEDLRHVRPDLVED